MATTVGHALCGVAILLTAAKIRPSPLTSVNFPNVALFAMLANLPDIDMLAGYLLTGDVLAYHGKITHGVLFALLSAWLTARIRQTDRRAYAAIIYFLVILSHDLIDSLTGPNLGWHGTHGMPMFWPLSEARLAMPVTLFPGPHHDTWARLISLHNLKVIAYELVVFAPLIASLSLLLGRCRDNDGGSKRTLFFPSDAKRDKGGV